VVSVVTQVPVQGCDTCICLHVVLLLLQPPSATSPSKQQGSIEPLQTPAAGISHVAAPATSNSNNCPQPVQVHVSINECVTFSVTVVEDATAVDAQALQVEKDAYIADLTQEVVELRELHGEIRQLHDDASSRCSTATAEASRWQARCGQLQEQLAVAQQAAEECQQQNMAWQQQLWWATREKLQEINSCWATRLDDVTRQHQQLDKACEEQQMLLEYRTTAGACWLTLASVAMQGDGREQLARMVFFGVQLVQLVLFGSACTNTFGH